MVGLAIPHPTVEDLISSVDQVGRSIASDADQSVQNASTPAKRRRMEERPTGPSIAYLLTPGPTPPTNRLPEASISSVGQETGVEGMDEVEVEAEIAQAGTEEAETREVTGARIEALSSLIPPYTMGVIRQDIMKDNKRKAAVTMKFSKTLDVQGAISFEIVDEAVEHLAGHLFNAHLQRQGDQRIFYYGDGGRRIGIGGGCTLLSCTPNAIPKFFGPLITAGNLETRHRKEEQYAGSSVTGTVIMSRFDKIGEGAPISIRLLPPCSQDHPWM
ncbi:hypothetical protein F5883DRAFT_592888 [Diaporthe sp. PMI_573]|nr:hypothetical protein F5883DRAFT_592888 [Diaporthaceae sp. PMI_573]